MTGSAPDHIGVIVVDVQGDFTEASEGSLAVAGTDRAFITAVAEATARLKAAGLTIFATQDWHPADHVSFYTSHIDKRPFDTIEGENGTQGLWPPHCVQGTENAKILIDTELFHGIVRKGQDRAFDSYSGFQDDGGQKTEMDAMLQQHGVRKLIIYGIATDYCVRATVLDAVQAGYEVTVVKELCRGVAPDTSASALEEMEQAGVVVADTLNLDRIMSS